MYHRQTTCVYMFARGNELISRQIACRLMFKYSYTTLFSFDTQDTLLHEAEIHTQKMFATQNMLLVQVGDFEQRVSKYIQEVY